METLLLPRTYPVLIGNGFLSFNRKKDTLPVFSIGKQQPFGFGFGFGLGLGLGLRIASVRVEAKKSKPDKKPDTHSFAAKPDEATGPFPEAVLLKEKKLQEDGSYLPDFADAEEEKLYQSLNLELESKSKRDTTRHYEVVYLVHEKHAEDVCKVNQKVQDFLKEKKGKVWRLNDWGMRSLAYRIQDADNANYILMNFDLGSEWVNDFKDMLDKDERVIRHLVMLAKSAVTAPTPPPPDFNSFDDDEEVDDDYEEIYMGDDDDDDTFDDDEDEEDDVEYDDDDDEDAEDDGLEEEEEDEEDDDDNKADGEDDDADDDTDLEYDEEESDDDVDFDEDAKSEIGHVSNERDGDAKTSRKANVKTSRR